MTAPTLKPALFFIYVCFTTSAPQLNKATSVPEFKMEMVVLFLGTILSTF